MNVQDKLVVARWSGATQNQRMLKALMPSYVKIDERSTSDLLAFAAEYSKLINYYSIDNSLVGDWSRFISNDISVFISSIISTNLRQIEREHIQQLHTLENTPRIEEKLDVLEGLFTHSIGLYKRINDWYEHTLHMSRLNPNDSTDLENELENAIKQQLCRNLRALLEFRRDVGFAQRGEFPDDIIEDVFHNIWFKTYGNLADETIDLEEGTIEQKIRVYTKQIRIQFRNVYSVVAYILQVAPKFLQKTLQEKDDHRPDAALFVAFLELFKHAQDQLNTITGQHLDFYFYDVLQMSERGYTADQVNLYFDLSKHVDTHFIKKGTLLNAGTDAEGRPLYYATDNDIELNRASIEQLRTLFVSKNPKIGIGSSYRLITNLYAAPIANSKDGMGERFINDIEDWPTFGEELLDKIEAERQMTFGDIGFALTAPILEMEEGDRYINMRMEFDKTSMHTLNLLIRDISKNRSISREDAFSRVFRNSLAVYFTTPQGWVQANACEVLPPSNWDLPEITISATLFGSAPAIAGYNSEIHGVGFDTTAPVVKILHQNINAIFSYSFFKELILSKINIDVTAKNLRNLSLSGDLGALNGNLPFQPFGPQPKVGSYMLIGKAELFKKELTDLQINIEWHNLPNHGKGMKGHYREYELGIENDSFKVQLTALAEGKFFPAPNDVPLEFRLFEDDAVFPAQLSKYTTIDNIEVGAFNIKPDPALVLGDEYTNQAQTGYFRLELTAPREGFATEQYINVYTKVLANNASPKKREDMMMPNQPYIPTIKTLSLNYSATAQVNIISIGSINKGEAVDEQLYHIHPYGILRTFHKGKMADQHLVPSYDEDAYLYVGLRDFMPPAPLSIYFELRDNPENLDLFESASSKPEIIWSYLVNNEWRDFSQTQILSDTTNSFNNSGIISLDVPRDLTSNNQLMPSGLHWLRIAVKGDATRLPRTLKVATQAVSATWHNIENIENPEHLLEPLAAKTIKELDKIITEVRAVEQPFKSFGGRPVESKLEFYTRVSERLRHKNRAVSAWDFERLVLEKFPDIFQVKCVTHLGNEAFVPKGSVVVTVVPRIDPDNIATLPRVNYSILQNIREYLQAHASPFMNIEVRNPIYERVKITAGMRFQKNKNNGTFLKKLNHDIMEFMCPWLRGISRELDLGGLVSKDIILSFIEKRPYVEFVTKFSAVQVFYDENQRVTGFDIDDTAIDVSSSPVIKASKPWSVLIPFETNPIYLLDENTFQAPEKSSINSMIISGDFVMTEEKDLTSDSTRDKRKR